MKNKNPVTRVEEKVEALLKTESSRRKFLSVTGKTLAVVSALPLLNIAGEKAHAAPASVTKQKTAIKFSGGNYILLKNGFIVDGTGKRGFNGNLLICDNRIEKISDRRNSGQRSGH